MCDDFWIGKDALVDIEEHRRLRKICKELKKEKDMLRESLSREQSVNAELIKRCESEITAASELHRKDEQYIAKLERELRNCQQEIEFLQDQLSVCSVGDVNSLEKRHYGVEKLDQKLKFVEEDPSHSDSKCLRLARQLEEKEAELENSALRIEKLESAILAIQLESQFELESLKLDVTTLEQRCFEAESFCHKSAQEKAHADILLDIKIQGAYPKIRSLEVENKELQERLEASERNIWAFFSKLEEHLDHFEKDRTRFGLKSDCALQIDMENDEALLNESSDYADTLRRITSKLVSITCGNRNMTDEMEKVLKQIGESDKLISELKEELREQKRKAEDEAEDLTQEMAELRYQITGMIEEERNRRALIEEASIRRIQELEIQLHEEKLKSSKAIVHFNQFQKDF